VVILETLRRFLAQFVQEWGNHQNPRGLKTYHIYIYHIHIIYIYIIYIMFTKNCHLSWTHPKISIARPLKAGRGGPIQLHDTRPSAMAQSRQQLNGIGWMICRK
jgi:hypothetical protein